MKSREGDGLSRGFREVRGVQGRSEGFIGGHWMSGEVREVRVGQDRSGKCKRGKESQSREVRECQGRLWNPWEVRGVLKTSVCSDNHKTFMKNNRFTCFITKLLRKFFIQGSV